MGVRSMYAGVSGLKNFQQQLDVIGNNIANSQTPGYKASRVTFQDLLSQTMTSATGGVEGGRGGTNPQQIGLGSTIGSIDTDATQGSILVTGRITDLAIQGEGFFSVTDGDGTYYTRAGAFSIDENGYFVSNTSGMKARGYNAVAGNLEALPGVLQVPVGIVIEATPTTSVDMVGNLDAGSEQIGSIHETGSFWAVEETADDNDLEGLYANGNLDNQISGLANLTSTVTVTVDDGGGPNTYTYTYTTSANPATAGRFNSLADLAAAMENDFGGGGTGDFASVSLNADGALEFLDCATLGTTVAVSSNNTSLNAALLTLNEPVSVPLNGDLISDEFSHRAEETDLLSNLRNDQGTDLGLATGNTVNIAGTIGGVTPIASTWTIPAGATLADYANQIQTEFGITNQADNVKMNALGKMQIYADGGSDYALSNLDISISGNTEFNDIFDGTTGNWAKTRDATDNHTMSFIAYDSVGTAHTVTWKLNIRDEAGGSNQWVWDVSSVTTATGVADSIPNNSGVVSFASTGALQSFSPTTIIVDPAGSVGDNMEIVLNPGTALSTDGLVCFDSESSARLVNGDGYTAGELEGISINEAGLITGNFTNGQNQALGQLALALFDNPAGLRKAGDNTYIETLNSGAATEGVAGAAGRGVIIPSALEGSNVDLAAEFVNMITAQRGYQTNARVVTASDKMLQELVGLVR